MYKDGLSKSSCALSLFFHTYAHLRMESCFCCAVEHQILRMKCINSAYVVWKPRLSSGISILQQSFPFQNPLLPSPLSPASSLASQCSTPIPPPSPAAHTHYTRGLRVALALASFGVAVIIFFEGSLYDPKGSYRGVFDDTHLPLTKDWKS